MTTARRRVALLVVAAALAAASPAFAAWVAGASGSASGRADQVLTPAAPTAAAVGTTVNLSWTATTLASGAPVTGYRVERVNTVTSAVVAATGGCAGAVTGLSCTETSVPHGTWQYRTAAVRGAWVGPTSPSSGTVTIDTLAPTISTAMLAKATGYLTGAIRQGGTYYVYANVTDPGTPATGVSTVRANVSTITTGATNLTLTAGTYTVGGVSYGYRTALQTATNPQAAGVRTFTVTATDVAGNSSGAVSFGATVDNTQPAASAVDVINGASTAGRAETGDQVIYTTTERLDPESVLSGWTGAATTVTVRVVNNGGGDRVQIYNAANTTLLPLGTIRLGNTGYVTATRNFTNSTMVQVNGIITITLGTPSGAVGTVTTGSAAQWTPVATPYDAAGNVMTTTSVTDSATDVQF